jgi:hypothetical protein
VAVIDAAEALPVTAPFLVVDNFLPRELAWAMRSGIEKHFSDTQNHAPQTHQIWNYWHVPGLYTYLRTVPDKLIDRQHVDSFVEKLRSFSEERLGLADVNRPYLSMYVNGCRQNLHNDSTNGRFAFVYSLTKDRRMTTGGETIVYKEGDLFRDHVAQANAGPGFFSSIEPSFNRLVIFDDRMPHAVERVDGSMDPLEGRFVFHGHIKERGPIVRGALKPSEANDAVMKVLVPFCDDAFARIRLYHGPLVLRLTVAPTGVVESCRVLVDRVTAPDRGDAGWDALRDDLIRRFLAIRFPEADGPTTISQPVLFGATLFR